MKAVGRSPGPTVGTPVGAAPGRGERGDAGLGPVGGGGGSGVDIMTLVELKRNRGKGMSVVQFDERGSVSSSAPGHCRHLARTPAHPAWSFVPTCPLRPSSARIAEYEDA